MTLRVYLEDLTETKKIVSREDFLMIDSEGNNEDKIK